MTNEEKDRQIADFTRDNLSPTKGQREKISARYNELQSFLKGRSFISGSYGRFTAVRPPKDLDVIWVCPDKKVQEAPREILVSLGRTLEAAYESQSKERIQVLVQDHSITIKFLDDEDDFAIDVVPASETERRNNFGQPIFCVPEIQKLSHMKRKEFKGTPAWIYSDPQGYIEEAKRAEGQTDGRFRRAAKLLKAWRQMQKKLYGESFKLKSFHLEQLVLAHVMSNPGNSILEVVHSVIRDLNRAIERPSIRDRADEQSYIDQYVADLTPAEKAKILELQGRAFGILTEIKTTQSASEVNSLLTQLTKSEKTERIGIPAVVIARPNQPYGGEDN